MVAKDPSAAQRLWSNSSTAEHGVVLPDLSAEIRKMDTMPVTGGGFCDVWIGERLGKEKVALKVLKMFGVPEQIRRVSLSVQLQFPLITGRSIDSLTLSSTFWRKLQSGPNSSIKTSLISMEYATTGILFLWLV